MNLMSNFVFKSSDYYYWKEESDIKNNTIRKIDLKDDRFLQLIAWNEVGYNDGDISITIKHEDSYLIEEKQFTRIIRDISIFGEYMIITWDEKKCQKK